MTIDARHGWNAAQRASERPLTKARVMHGPVKPVIEHLHTKAGAIVNGVEVPYGALYGDLKCKTCKYNACSCPPMLTMTYEQVMQSMELYLLKYELGLKP